MDSLKPIFIDLNIDKNNEYLNNSFKGILLKKYNSYHNDIYNFCVNYEKDKPDNIELPKYIYDKINQQKKMPKYIIDYFNDIQNDFKNTKNKKLSIEKLIENLKKILERIRNKEELIDELNKYLENSIDEYIYNKKDIKTTFSVL